MSATTTSPVLEALTLLHEPGSVFEVRIPKAGRAGTISGYFDDCEAAAKAIARYDHKAPGIYVTLNPVDPALLARAANRLKERAEATTCDADVVRRNSLLIDVDFRRPAGVSATDDEVEAAGRVARKIRTYLTAAGWPGCVLVMSGNGWHLLYRIDLPNDTASRDLVKRLLERLAVQFNAGGVEVDTSVFNAARVSKVPGTWVCKGDELPDRPYRQSCIEDRPGDLQVVDAELLQAVAGPESTSAKSASSSYRDNGHAEFDVEEWMSRYGLRTRKHKADAGGDLWELEVCPFNSEHASGEASGTPRRWRVDIRRLPARDLLIQDLARPARALRAGIQRASADDRAGAGGERNAASTHTRRSLGLAASSRRSRLPRPDRRARRRSGRRRAKPTQPPCY